MADSGMRKIADLPVIIYGNRLASAVGMTTTGSVSNAAAAVTPYTYEYASVSGEVSFVSPIEAGEEEELGVGVLASAPLSKVVVETSADGATGWVELARFEEGAGLELTTSTVVLPLQGEMLDWVRIRLEGGSRIMALFVGDLLMFEHPIQGSYSPMAWSRTTELSTNISQRGQYIGRSIRAEGFESDITIPRMSIEFANGPFQRFVESARRGPYFYLWAPISFPDQAVYCWTDEDIVAQYTGRDGQASASWSMRGLG